MLNPPTHWELVYSKMLYLSRGLLSPTLCINFNKIFASLDLELVAHGIKHHLFPVRQEQRPQYWELHALQTLFKQCVQCDQVIILIRYVYNNYLDSQADYCTNACVYNHNYLNPACATIASPTTTYTRTPTPKVCSVPTNKTVPAIPCDPLCGTGKLEVLNLLYMKIKFRILLTN